LQTRLHAEGSRQPVTPDFTTSVDLDSVKLAKPKRPEPSKSAKWVGLEGLDQRTAGSLIPETLKEVSNSTIAAKSYDKDCISSLHKAAVTNY
jgi:hypothetical protein